MWIYGALAVLFILYWVIIGHTHTWFFVALSLRAIWNEAVLVNTAEVIYG
jgi:hypothetical protein